MRHSIKLLALAILAGSISCKKPEGEGGLATITGKIISKNIHAKDLPYSTEDAEAGETVYISYGDKAAYDDDYKTSYDGTFTFKYLRPGTYKIFTYSLDSTLTYASGKDPVKVPVVKTVVIDKKDKKDVIDIGGIGIYKEANDGGSAQIKGKVFAKYYNGSFTILQGQAYAPDEDVMIMYGDDTSIANKVTTSADGSFEFNFMRKGKYTIYVISEDPTQQSPSGDMIVKKTIEITGKNEVVNMDDLIIYK